VVWIVKELAKNVALAALAAFVGAVAAAGEISKAVVIAAIYAALRAGAGYASLWYSSR